MLPHSPLLLLSYPCTVLDGYLNTQCVPWCVTVAHVFIVAPNRASPVAVARCSPQSCDGRILPWLKRAWRWRRSSACLASSARQCMPGFECDGTAVGGAHRWASGMICHCLSLHLQFRVCRMETAAQQAVVGAAAADTIARHCGGRCSGWGTSRTRNSCSSWIS